MGAEGPCATIVRKPPRFPNLNELQLPSLQNLRILVVGDLMLDRYWHGVARRISPEAPVPVVDVQRREDRPGGAANVALNLISLGARCTLVGCVGEDALADALEEKLSASGVDCDWVVCRGGATTLKLRILSRRQQLLRSDFDHRTPLDAAKELAERAKAHLAEAKALILADYDKGALADPAGLIQAAARAGAPVLADPKAKPLRTYAGASMLKPNRREFEAAMGGALSEEELGERATALCRELAIGALAVTRGADGMTLATGEGCRHLPARPVEVFDVTGAGDTAAAALGIALGLGWPALQGARLANVAASLAVAKCGTSAVSGPELSLALGGADELERGMLSRERLAQAVQAARQAGRRIVFTNGCFDLLHAGHVACLTQAKALGDRLIVAVNDDASVARLKGAGRPVNALERRLQVLAGLAAVDWVTSFAEDTPEALLRLLKPDVLAKGGDYRPEEVVGADIVGAYGGTVKVLGLVADCSTSGVLRQLPS